MGGQRNRLKSPKLAVDLKVCRTVLNTERLLKDEAPGPRKRNRARVLRGRLSQVASLPRPKTKVAYLGGRMTELNIGRGLV